MNQDDKKRAAAQAALAYVEDGTAIGVGTGSTVNYFIEGLAALKNRIEGAVSSSQARTSPVRRPTDSSVSPCDHAASA